MVFMPMSQLRKLSLKCKHSQKSRNYLPLGRRVILIDEKMEAQRGEVICSGSQSKKVAR